MDPGVSVQKQNFTRNPENLSKVPGTRELVKISLNHCTSTPHRSETNGIAERAVRRVKEGTSAVLLQSGLNESWWADSMECYTYLRHVTDLLSDVKTPYERRFGKPLKGPTIPFGSLVEYHPITAKDQSRIHQSGKKVLPGLFLGYPLYAGGIWKGDVLISDLEELETMDASEIYSKRLNAKEVIFPQEGEFIFPIADGRIKTLGEDQALRTSTLVRHRPIQWEGHNDFLGESGGSLPQPQDSLPDAGEAMNDFWSMSGNFIFLHHVEPIVKLYSPSAESFPIPLKYIDVSRTTHTNLDVKQEKRIDDYWNIDGSRDLSDPWTGFTRFTLLEEKAPDEYMWSRERLTRIQLTSRPDHLWPELWKSMGKHAKLKKSKSGLKKSSILKTLENWEGSISSTLRIRNSKKPSRTHVRNWKHHSLLLCLVKFGRKIVGVVDPTNRKKKKQDLRVFWKRMKLQDCVWENLYHIIMKTILQEKETIHYSITIWFTNLFLCLESYENSCSKSSGGQGMGKIGENFGLEPDESMKWKKDVIDEARTKGVKVLYASLMDICHLKNAELDAKHQNIKVE